jgi:hypothetical protein
MTKIPKSMRQAVKTSQPTEDMGEIVVGADGVVVPPKSPGTLAAETFTSRRPQSTHEDLLQRMAAIDKKSRAMKEAKGGPENKKIGAPSKRPETLVYEYLPRRWVQALNATACLASVREDEISKQLSNDFAPLLSVLTSCDFMVFAFYD